MESTNKNRGRFFKIVAIVLGTIAVLLVVLSLALQWVVVQNYTADRLTDYLSKKTKTKVSIDHVNFTIFDHFLLNGFYVEDEAGDTLMYSERLEISFESRLWGLLRKDLKISSLSLHNTQLNVRRDTNEYLDNLQVILNRLKNQEQDTTIASPIGIRFNVKEMELNRVLFSRHDQVEGNSLDAFVKYGRLRVEKIDLQQQYFKILRAELRNSDVKIENFQPNPIEGTVAVVDPVTKEVVPVDSLNILRIEVDQFRFRDGAFTFDNNRDGPKTTPDDLLDYDHLKLYDIDSEINRFSYYQKEFKARLDYMNFSELSGFELYNLAATEAIITPQKVSLAGMQLKTPHSSIGDTLIFSYDDYADFNDFNEKVSMRIVLEDSKVRLRDIMTFAAPLYSNPFFRANANRDIQLSGVIDGTINDLRGDDLVLGINGSTRLEGRFTIDDPDEPSKRISVYLDNLRTNMSTLRDVIPNFSLPSNFDRLGNIRYSGTVSQLFNDFLLDGTLYSDLGTVEDLDIKFADIDRGFGNASYEGSLSLVDFDLKEWTQNEELGKITMRANVEEGKGLTGSTANAKLSAQVERFNFRNYTYEDIAFDGQLSSKLFNGELNLKDNNIAFDFLGTLDYTGEVPNFDFDLDLQRLNLKPLNLAKKDWSVAGKAKIDMQLIDNDLSQSEGSLLLDTIIFSDPNYTQTIDYINIHSNYSRAGRNILVISNLFDLQMQGHYELTNVWQSMSNYLYRHFPTYAEEIKLPIKAIETDTSQINYKLNIYDSGSLTRFFDPKLDTIQNLNVYGDYSSTENALSTYLSLPYLQYDSVTFEKVGLAIDLQSDTGTLNMVVKETTLKNGTAFDQLSLTTALDGELLNYQLNYNSIDNPNYNANLKGSFQPYDSVLYELNLNTNELVLFGKPWQVRDNNFFRFGGGQFYTKSLRLHDGKNSNIQLNAYGRQGLDLNLEGFQLGIIDSLWDYEPLNFSGSFNLNVRAENVMQLNNLSANILSDSLLINNDYWGHLSVNATADNPKSPINSTFILSKAESQVTATTKYNPPTLEDIKQRKLKPNYLDANIEVNSFPLDFLRYFIAGASDFVGTIDGNMQLLGDPSKPNVKGEVYARNSAVTVDFLQTRYFIDNQRAKINNRLIDATNAIIVDEEGNTAKLKGGITHDRLKNLGLNLQLKTDRFLAMNTTKEDSDAFYGKALGGGTVDFQGSFTQTNIVINATAGRDTKITIPVTSETNAPEVSFIEFKNKNPNADTSLVNLGEAEGVDLDLFLTLTEAAEVELVFDERAGDIMRGQGRGDLQIYLDRTGEMAMYGNYFIERGEYLFTLLNVVNKPFVVRRGGTITWRGDPVNAQINLEAEYKNLDVAVNNLIQEYLLYAPTEIRQQAAYATDVNLLMHLQGELYQPTINFEIAFPMLQGDLKNYTDNKLRVLQQDENELNRQVFGLIVLGQFLPSDFVLTGQSSENFGINTVSEFVSNQLSILLTDMLGEAVDNVDFISGIDVDLDYNRYDNQIDFAGDNFYLNGQEYYIRQKTSLWNDRVTLTVGGNVTSAASQDDTGTMLGGDFIVDVILNDQRTWRLNIFYIRRPSLVGSLEGAGGLDQQSGIGVSYEREFDSFKNMFRSIFRRKEE